MKSIRVIAILALLILFPLISYIYLRQGYYFRLDALRELEPKSKIADFNFESFDPQTTYDISDLAGHVSLLYNNDNASSVGMLLPIYEEFSHREDFQLIGFTIDSSNFQQAQNNNLPSKQWKFANAPYQWEKQVTLIDTSGTIRNSYDLDSSSFLSLGQHIPIVLPRKKEQDIKMKKQ